MALTFGFYNSVNHDRKYDAIQVGQIFDGIIRDGVYETYKKALIVKPGSGSNQVIIQPGRAWFDHTWSYNDSDYVLSMPNTDGYSYRIDAVVLDINQASGARRNSFQVVQGTPSSSPSRPSLINTTDHHQYPLAYVWRTNSGTGIQTITAADITNMVGTSACPFVTGVVSSLDTDDLIAQWEAGWEQFMASCNSTWNSSISSKNTQWNNLINEKNSDWNSLISAKNTAWNTFINEKNTAWANNLAARNSEFNTFLTNSRNTFDSFMSSSRNTFDSFMSSSRNTFDSFMSSSRNAFNSFMTTSRNEYNAFKAEYLAFMQSSRAEFRQFMEESDAAFEAFLEYKNKKAERAIVEFRQMGTDAINEFRGSTEEFLESEREIWHDWFVHIQGQLSEDAATRLQKQIDSLAFATVLKRRAVLGITAYSYKNMVVFGAWASKTGETVIVGAPTQMNVYISGLRAIISSIVATVDKKKVLFDTDWATFDGETVFVEAPVA